MKAVVMAGGEGSRLRPITANVPKPLVPICNKPLMAYIVEHLKRYGVREIVSTLHYLADEIQGYFGDGSDFDVEMSYSIEDTPLGTAGSVKKAESQLRDGTFLIVSGDALTDCDFEKALEFHRENGSVATLILTRVSNPLDFGVVVTDEDGRITRFLEKPSWSEVFSDTINTGMYLLEPEVFDLMEAGKRYDWSQDIFPQLLHEGKPVFGYVMGEYWCDVGSLNQYREAHEHVLAGRLQIEAAGDEYSPGVIVGPGAVIDESVTFVPPVCVGHNVKIKPGARIGPYSVIGDNCFVEEDAVIERSIVWENAYIGPSATLTGAIACSRTTIKKDCVVNEDAVIGDRCLLDVGSVIRPRVKLWPDKIIERGSIVTMSLIWGNKWRGNLFRELGVAGLSNIEITPDFATRLGAAFGSCLPSRSKVVTSRDSTRSSRMVKRALIASLLSVGCDVLDLRSAAVPTTRHFIKTSGAAGAVNIRKLPGNSRVTLIEFFDERGAYLGRSLERKVETVFFREDFNRADPDDLGVIEFASRATEEYQADFLRHIELGQKPSIKIACDYGFSSLATIFPSMLARMGVDSISLNAFSDAKSAPRSDEEIESHVHNLSQITRSLQCHLGVLFLDEGERMIVIDGFGRTLKGNQLFGVLAGLVATTVKGPKIVMGSTGSGRIQAWLEAFKASVIRAKADVRSLMDVSLDEQATFAGDLRGRFVFPEFHPGFDAAFSFAKMVQMMGARGSSLAELVDALPVSETAYRQVPCPWEIKGSVMRRLSEEWGNETGEPVDGVRRVDGQDWTLVLPDAVEPAFHVYSESDSLETCETRAEECGQFIQHLRDSV